MSYCRTPFGKSDVDLSRFRSIYSTWRSLSIPNDHHYILPFKFPLLKLPFRTDPNDIVIVYKKTSLCYLTKQNIFLIKPPQQEEQTLTVRPWFIITNQNMLGQTNCFHPLPQRFSFDCRFVLDHNKLSVLHLGSTFFKRSLLYMPWEKASRRWHINLFPTATTFKMR